MRRVTLMLAAMALMVSLFAAVAYAATIVGTDKNDTITETNRDDTIAGRVDGEVFRFGILRRHCRHANRRSPPMPVSFCEVTSSTAPVATAASMALPPCLRMSIPA